MIVEMILISEHPSGTWDCCLGPFYSSYYRSRLIFVCIVKYEYLKDVLSVFFFFSFIV